MRRSIILTALVVLAGCSPASKGDQQGATAPTLPAVRAAIVAGNYGEAGQTAQNYVASHPGDPDGYFEQARAEALAGNQGRAFDSLGKAIDHGLGNAAQALDDHAFDSIRGDDRFAALVQKSSPAPQSAQSAAVAAGSGTDHVEISSHAGGTQIQAGDVKLNTNF